MNETKLVVGRSVSDYILTGQRLEAPATVCRCLICNDPVAFSPDGIALIQEGALPVCTPCARVIASKAKEASAVITKNAADQAERSPNAKRQLDRLLETIFKKR